MKCIFLVVFFFGSGVNFTAFWLQNISKAVVSHEASIVSDGHADLPNVIRKLLVSVLSLLRVHISTMLDSFCLFLSDVPIEPVGVNRIVFQRLDPTY